MENNTVISQDDIKKKISEIANIDNSSAWSVIDKDVDAGLYLIHHVPEANLSLYGHVRGIVVDIVNKVVVSRAYKHTPTVINNNLKLDSDGSINLVDIDGDIHSLNPQDVKLQTGFEGTLVHVFKHANKVYFGTRKRLNFSRSKWGSSKTFEQMFTELSGPNANDLFDSECSYSPFCHVFIMVYPDLLVASKDNVEDGYLVYLGYQTMDWVSNSPFELSSVETQPKVVNTSDQRQSISDDVLRGIIYKPKQLSLEEANKHLRTGFFDIEDKILNDLDDRMLPGEFIIIYKPDGSLLKVESLGYSWRCGMRNNDPNLYHRFFQLMNGSYLDYSTIDGHKQYNDLYPTMVAYEHAGLSRQLREIGPMSVLPQVKNINSSYLMDRNSRLYNIWLCFFMSVPLNRQYEVINYLNNFYSDRTQVIKWIKDLENSNDVESLDICKRVKDIINAARKFAKNGRTDRRDKFGNLLTFRKLVKDNIRNFLLKEEGTSLYRLIRDMKRWIREQEKEKEVPIVIDFPVIN
jgi:hypothetical protein